MPIKQFKCPDNEYINVEECLSTGGCRMPFRCAPLPYLEKCRETWAWKGYAIPSMAGTGPRLVYLRNTTDYIVSPQDLAAMFIGNAMHRLLGLSKFNKNVFSEESLKNIHGKADNLQPDETREGHFILIDYKVWGSVRVMRGLGMRLIDEKIKDNNGNVILYKSGAKKGEIKTHKIAQINPEWADLRSEELQLNRYRTEFENEGYPISRMFVFAMVRDGRTRAAFMNKIDSTIYMIPIKRMDDEEVERYYCDLAGEINAAFQTGWARKCDSWESWEGKRCNYCEVKNVCDNMGE